MKTELTDRQKEILTFIQAHIEINGYPPTYREIGIKFNIASTFGVKRHLDALIKKGYLNSESNSSRTLSLTKINDAKTNHRHRDSLIEIPIVGRVAAGYPVLAQENIEGTFQVDPTLINKRENCFALKVRGDSMINAGILEGDLVVISQQTDVSNGDIVVALIGDEATLKRFNKDGNTVYLIPENSNYSAIEVSNREDFSIVGKIISVFRFYN
ncbi:MAG: repressor LexA [Ignavibacteria bacterium RBG_13_36_8]|nr:MAG: repressor LexA [Ignavibacteria bacterium RBG_13_36_8]